MEALVHTVSAIVSARRVRPNVLHLHNIGPALAIPLARALGFPVVVTHHSLNYRHEKWGSAARFLLRAGERSSARLAAARIAVSREIQEVLAASYGASSVLIPNGVALEPWEENSGLLDRLGLQPRRYVLFVGRFSPEKRLLDLIEAFSRAAVPGWSLALTGGVTLDDAYRRRVVERAGAIPGVVLTGFQDGAQLAELYARAGCFALPSSHEGQPLALLEALASGAPSIASDIPAHRALALPEESYFPPCEIDALAGRLRLFAESGIERDRWTVLSSRILSEFDWERVADRTLEVLAGAARRASAAMA